MYAIAIWFILPRVFELFLICTVPLGPVMDVRRITSFIYYYYYYSVFTQEEKNSGHFKWQAQNWKSSGQTLQLYPVHFTLNKLWTRKLEWELTLYHDKSWNTRLVWRWCCQLNLGLHSLTSARMHCHGHSPSAMVTLCIQTKKHFETLTFYNNMNT